MPEAPISPRQKLRAALRRRTLIFNVALASAGISALFIAGKRKRQRSLASACSGARQHPCRRIDMAAPPDPSMSTQRKREEISRSVGIIASGAGSLLASTAFDFLVSSDAVWLIEINPRSGATLDVFESNESSLFARHVAACEGGSTPTSPRLAFKAAEIVYALCDMVAPERRSWPHWAVDRSMLRTRFSSGDPVCTVLASGAGPPSIWRERWRASGRRAIIALVQEAEH